MLVVDKVCRLRYIGDISYTFPEEENKSLNAVISGFADAMNVPGQSSEYWTGERNAVDPWENNARGKKGEYGLVEILHQEFGLPRMEVDIEIRKGRKKGWREDLILDEDHDRMPRFHAKTCNLNTYMKYGKDYSWIFQVDNKKSKGGKDPITSGIYPYPNDVVAFMYVETWESPTVHLKALVPVGALHDWNQFKDPWKRDLRNIKTAVYLRHLERYKDELETWEAQTKS